MDIIVICLVSYLMGSIPFGFILTKIFLKKDIREIGSGNIGATNALRTGNKLIGYSTLLLDVIKAGAVGFICSSFIKQDGGSLPFRLQDRMIAISLDEIMKTPKRIMVASGPNKFEAVKAALDGGYVTHAIIDDQLASLLLRN